MTNKIISGICLLTLLTLCSSAASVFTTNTLPPISLSQSGFVGILNFTAYQYNYTILVAASGGQQGSGALIYNAPQGCRTAAAPINDSAAYIAICPSLSGQHSFNISAIGSFTEGQLVMAILQFNANMIIASNGTTGYSNSITLFSHYPNSFDICAYGQPSSSPNPSGTEITLAEDSDIMWNVSDNLCNINKDNQAIQGSIAGASLFLANPRINLTDTPNTIDTNIDCCFHEYPPMTLHQSRPISI